MSDPQTTNVGLYQPTRGSDSGTWDSPVNANTGTADSLAANIAAISLSNSPVTLTTPPNSGASWSGPYQSQSGILQFTGALTGNVTVTIPRAGFFIVENLCTGVNLVKLASAAPGRVICAPPGEATHIYCDGTDVKYVDLGRVGSYIDFGRGDVPLWINGCTVPPYLYCNGATFSAVTYPALAAVLNGTTLPDTRGRARASINDGTSRITIGASGIDGNAVFSAADNQSSTLTSNNIPQLPVQITDPGHFHTAIAQVLTSRALLTVGGSPSSNFAAIGSIEPGQQLVIGNVTGITAASNVGTLNSSFTNIGPTYIGGITMIRAA